MKTIAIIGPIGSGKSTIRKMFHNVHNVRTIDLDKVAKDLKCNPELQEQLVKAFGKDIIDPNNEVIKNYTLDHIFPDNTKYLQMIQIHEPFIRDFIENEQTWYDHSEVELLVFEGASLIHSPNLLALFDHIIWIEASYNICYERVYARGRYTESQIHTLLDKTIPTYSKALREYPANKITTISEPNQHQDMINTICAQLIDGDSLKRTVIYQGSFNPLHIGHISVVEELLRTFDKVILLRCVNGAKTVADFFPIKADKLPAGCVPRTWDRSFVEYLKAHDADNVVIARGIRNGSDLDYETQYVQHLEDQCKMHQMVLPPVIYVPCKPQYKHISSSSIRAILPFDESYARTLII